jgi:hypothetical protein
VDARDKRGHDDGEADSIWASGLRQSAKVSKMVNSVKTRHLMLDAARGPQSQWFYLEVLTTRRLRGTAYPCTAWILGGAAHPRIHVPDPAGHRGTRNGRNP